MNVVYWTQEFGVPTEHHFHTLDAFWHFVKLLAPPIVGVREYPGPNWILEISANEGGQDGNYLVLTWVEGKAD